MSDFSVTSYCARHRIRFAPDDGGCPACDREEYDPAEGEVGSGGERMFPVLWHWPHEQRCEMVRLGCPHEVPWELLEPHEAQALRNHEQTLEQLAKRGGLSPQELVAVLCDCRWNDRPAKTNTAAVNRLLMLLEATKP